MREEARQLEKTLRALLSSEGGVPSRLVVHPIRRGHLSRVFRGKDPAANRSFVIKVCVDPITGQADSVNAADYYEALSSVVALAQLDDKIGCAKPILLLRAQAIVVASWIDGPTVEQVVQRGSRLDARRAITLSGEWLARFHGAAGLTQKIWDLRPARARLDEMFQAAVQSHLSSSVLAQAVRTLHQTAERVGAIPIPWSRQHGDFKPGNLILTADGVAAIDIDFRAPAPCIVDAAQFLNHGALQRPWRLRRSGWVSFVDEAFSAGSVLGGANLPALPLAWARLHHVVRLHTQYRQWSKPPKSWITGWSIHCLLQRLTAELAL